jgi:heme/copper-type cytochrome/quinol oxidase subunit 2
LEPAGIQLTVLAIASLIAAGAAVTAVLRALARSPAASADSRPNRTTEIVWALVPLTLLGAVLLAVVVNSNG